MSFTGSPVNIEASDSFTQNIVGDVSNFELNFDKAGAPFNIDIYKKIL